MSKILLCLGCGKPTECSDECTGITCGLCVILHQPKEKSDWEGKVFKKKSEKRKQEVRRKSGKYFAVKGES